MRKIRSFVLAILILSGTMSMGTAYAQRDCPRSRLIAFQKGQVTAGAANRMREEPSASSRLIDTIPANSIFRIYETGRCVEGYLWARILYNNQIGWTAEAQGSDYFVEPVAPPDGAIVIPAGVYDVAWSSDGKTIALATSEGVYLVNTTLATPIPTLFTHESTGEVEFSPTEPDMLATSGGTGMVRVWDIAAKKILYEDIINNANGVSLDGNGVGDLHFSSDGYLLFAVTQFDMNAYDTATWGTTHVLKDYTVSSAAMSPDGQQIAVVPWYPDKPYLVNWSGEKTTLDTGDLSDVILTMRFSPDNKMLAMSDNQGHVLNQILATGEQHSYTAQFEGDYHLIYGFTFSPDSTLLAIGDFTAQDGVLRLMNTATMQQIGTLTPDEVDEAKQFAFSPDGSQIASIFDNMLLIVNTADLHE